MSWRKLKELIQSLDEQHEGRKKGEPFEELIAELLELLLETHFETAKSGYQPIGDAINEARTIVVQSKNYSDETPLDRKEILGDIEEADLELSNLQTYVLAASRTIDGRLLDRLNNIEEKTGLDIITLELTDSLSELGALCVTFWGDIDYFFDSSEVSQQFLDWVKKERDKSKTVEKIAELKSKLKQGQQTRRQVQKDTKEYLLKRFGGDSDHNLRFNYSIDLSQAIKREFLEREIAAWWETLGTPICYLEGEEGMGKSWLAAKCVNSICSDQNIVTFWLDSNRWGSCKSLNDLLQACLKTIPGYQDENKITKLKRKIRDIWWPPTLIVLDGVNEGEAIGAAKRILGEYFTHESELKNKIRFLLTTRPLDAYRNFAHNLWDRCDQIVVETFNDTELQEALIREGLQPNDLPNSLMDIAKIPRYFQTCIRLRGLFDSFDNVNKEMVLWADLLYKIKHTDPQVRQKFDWQDIEDAQEDLAKLAREAKWTNIDDTPQASLELLMDCFPNYHEIRRDLEEQRIALKAHKRQAKLSEDHILLGWAVHLSNIFDSTKFSNIENLFERFQQELEPIPSENLRTQALFVALQISAISPGTDISEDQLSQKRAALILAWSNSHNASVTDERLSFWTEEDPDAYAQVVEFEFERQNVPKYEEMLIEPLARMWLNKKGQFNRLASRLDRWLRPTHSTNSPENREYTDIDGLQVPVQKYDPQVQLSSAALSILSQRPERQFLKTLACCYEILGRYESSDQKDIGVLMRWGYTEEVLGNLHWLAELAQFDALLLEGVYGLAANLRLVNLPLLLQRPLSQKDREWNAYIEERHRSSFVNRIRNKERLLASESPEANMKRSYYGLDRLAVRTDLPDLCDGDQGEIRRILGHISTTSTELEISRDLIPWIAKYSTESYSEFACNFKINALNFEYPPYVLRATQGLIFKSKDCEKISEAILGMKEFLIQGDDSSFQRARFLTEILLFSASEDKLVNWFKFLAAHETLRKSVRCESVLCLLERLLPTSIVRLAQQRLEILRSSISDDLSLSNSELEKFSEEDFWSWVSLCVSDNGENTITWALKNLKRRKSDVHPLTFYFLHKATLDSERFLSEIFIDKEVRKHLFLREGRFFPTPVYKGENSYTYEDLVSVLPQEIVGSFLCSPKRRADLSRWGKELMERNCSILQGAEGDSDSIKDLRFRVNRKVLRAWAEQNTIDFLHLADEYLTGLSKSPWFSQEFSDFTDNILCLLLRFQPGEAMKYYHQWKSEGFRTVYSTQYGVETFLAQLWRVGDCSLPEHYQHRRELLEGCLNDEEIMFMTLAALAEEGEEELWNLVTQDYLTSPYAKERNLGVSILPWFGKEKAIEKLKQLKSEDSSQWVRDHASWAYEIAQQERSCREVYREALQARDLFRISAVFEQIKPVLLPTARWWHYQIEGEVELYAEPQGINPKFLAFVEQFWGSWENSLRTKRNFEVFGRKLREYCRGENFLAGRIPRIAPWWKPVSDRDSL